MELTSSSPVQLALATLFGASVMAISAFYIHKRSVDQVLDRLIKLRRKSSPSAADDKTSFVSDDDSERFYAYDREIDADESTMNGHRVSSSMPDVLLPNEWLNKDSHQALSTSLDNQLNLIPSGLPPLRTDQRDGTSLSSEAVTCIFY